MCLKKVHNIFLSFSKGTLLLYLNVPSSDLIVEFSVRGSWQNAGSKIDTNI